MRGRKPLPPTESSEIPLNDGALRDDLQQVEARAADLAIIDARFSDGLPFDLLRYELRCKEKIRNTAREMLDLGALLITVREHVPNGDWLGFLDRIGVAARVAQKFMQATLKFSNAPSTAHLENLGQTKLLELAVLDDEDIKELAEGGTIAGLALDDIDRMSVRELRKALRESKDEGAAKDRLLAEKNHKLDELTTKKPVSKGWDEKAHALIYEADQLFVLVQQYLGQLLAVQEQIMAAEFGDDTDTQAALRFCAVAYSDKLTRTSQLLSELRGMHERTLGAFADELDTHPVDYDAAQAGVESLGNPATVQ